MKPKLEWLLVFVPAALILEIVHGPAAWIFATSAIAILPLAGLIGHSTEELALHTGPQIGGLLNATMGNVAEMIIAFFLILEGELEVVKASLTGSIIGNVLLVLGLAFLAGGWTRTEQTFSRSTANLHSTSLMIAVVALLLPALFHLTPEATAFREEAVSVGVAIVLIATYLAGLAFSLKTHRQLFRTHGHAPEEEEHPKWSRRKSLTLLTASTVGVAVMSEFLVGALEETVSEFGLSKLFVGLIIIPIVGNAAEHSSAIFLAAKNKVDISIEIAIGSSTQIALFIAPLLVFLSLAVGNPMNLIFSGLEVAAVGFSAAILGFIVLDGRANWFEGAQLVAAYIIMAVSFFFL
ncbi:MAG TPA: calcium/proton exchanger [Actinomycetota bacterium]|jgi:Ca2+:H+ antiporter|nr:calcium/proton exchanger [Actinomycetota bacterium]